MQHYLRHALFAAFADRDQQTILELIRILTNDDARVRYTNQLTDPMERAFWRDECGAEGTRARPSIKAVLNKLALSFLRSIRSLSDRATPDLAADGDGLRRCPRCRLSGVAATTRAVRRDAHQPLRDRRRRRRAGQVRAPAHLLVSTSPALPYAGSEGSSRSRKFGLHAALAAQSLSALGERLAAQSVRTWPRRAAEPGPKTFETWAGCFAPVAPEESWRCVGSTSSCERAEPMHPTRSRRAGFDAWAFRSRTPAANVARATSVTPSIAEGGRRRVHRRSGGDEPERRSVPPTSLVIIGPGRQGPPREGGLRVTPKSALVCAGYALGYALGMRQSPPDRPNRARIGSLRREDLL